MNFETPLTVLVWITSIVSVVLTYVISYLLIPELGDGTMWWKLSTVITCGTLAGAIIPELVKVFTSTESAHVREVVSSSREGGASLNILAGLVAGNFSAYWLGLSIVGLMSIAYWVSLMGFDTLMIAAPVFAFGLVAFGFLGMGPVTIAVDSYGPVTDNAQSVFELSVIEHAPGIKEEIKRDYGFVPDFATAKHLLEENDGAGNTFKATAKPVLDRDGRRRLDDDDFFDRGAADGRADAERGEAVDSSRAVPAGADYRRRADLLVYGRVDAGGHHRRVSRGRVHQGEHQAGRASRRRRWPTASASSRSARSMRREGCSISSWRCSSRRSRSRSSSPIFFIGYLISIALFGLFQAIFMANAGGAWDNAKKVVEVELKEKGTPLHAATVIGDTVGDPFKDTSSVAMNPIIKFTTLFGLLAVELAVQLTANQGPPGHRDCWRRCSSVRRWCSSGDRFTRCGSRSRQRRLKMPCCRKRRRFLREFRAIFAC